MKIRFYFDYSDYKSYLMMHALASINDLPLTVQWIVVDAYSLRALSGSEFHDNAPNETEFLKREAVRYCQREGLDFVWQNERIHSGTALRVGVWLMQNAPQEFVRYSQKVLEMLWGTGKTIDASCVRSILETLNIDADEMFRTISERDGFQYQDACLQEALSDGVFDVPAVVIGNELVCHFDMAREIRRLAILEWLQTLPQESVYLAYTAELLALSRDEFKHHVATLVRKNDVRQATVIPLDTNIIQIQHTLSVPDALWHLSRLPARGDILCHVCSCAASGNAQEILASAISDSLENAINICPVTHLEFNDDADFESAVPDSLTPRLFYAAILFRGVPSMLYIRIDSNGAPHIDLTSNDPSRAMLWETARGWSIAAFSHTGSCDLNMARLAAHRGAHVLIRIGGKDNVPFAEAFGCMAAAWVIDLQHHAAAVVDAEAHRKILAPGSDIRLNASYRLPETPGWTPSAPRTLLLCDKALTFGELSANADIELASRGINLLVTTNQQSSELSNTRVFERIRIGEINIALLPVCGEQIFVSELISHRIIEVYNRATRDSIPIIVNYWSDLEFEMLEVMRPVLASSATTFRMPVILVVGSQIVEIWLPGTQGNAYLIEKDDDCYTIDISDLVQIDDLIQQILAQIGISEADFLGRLQKIENIAKK